MPSHKKKCCESSSSSSSSSSCSSSSSTECGQCHGQTSSEYKEQCPPPACPGLCKGMDCWEIFQKWGPGVVRVHTETVLTTSTNPEDRLPPAGQLSFQNNVGTLLLNGNGFFIDKHIVVTPAHLVLLPPDVTTVYNRYPFVENQINAATLNGSNMVRVGRIVVDVFDVNGSGHSYTYEAELLGVDASGDLALLYINTKDCCWNRKLRCIKKCHPYFKFGCSRKYRACHFVMSIGDPFSRGLPIRSVAVPSPPPTVAINPTQQSALNTPNAGFVPVVGKVQDIAYVDYLGYAQQELIVCDLNIYSYNSGLPFINQYGQVIGMQTTAVSGAAPYIAIGIQTGVGTESVRPVGDGFVAGPSSYFMLRSIKHLYAALCGCITPFVTCVSDPFGNYLRYVHGYLGVSWTVFTGQDYLTYVNAQGYNAPRVAADGVTPLCSPKKKEVIGLKIRALASPDATAIAPAGIVVPGPATPGTVGFVASPLAGVATYNDVITHANCIPLGDLPLYRGYHTQAALSILTWRLQPGESVTLGIRRLDEEYECVNSVAVCAACFPAFMDYPWYRYPFFCAMVTDLQPMNGSNFNSLFPVVPAVTGNTSFVPAI